MLWLVSVWIVRLSAAGLKQSRQTATMTNLPTATVHKITRSKPFDSASSALPHSFLKDGFEILVSSIATALESMPAMYKEALICYLVASRNLPSCLNISLSGRCGSSSMIGKLSQVVANTVIR